MDLGCRHDRWGASARASVRSRSALSDPLPDDSVESQAAVTEWRVLLACAGSLTFGPQSSVQGAGGLLGHTFVVRSPLGGARPAHSLQVDFGFALRHHCWRGSAQEVEEDAC